MGNRWSPGCNCCESCTCESANAALGYNNLTLSGLAGSAILTNAAEQYSFCQGGAAPTTTYSFPGFAGGSTAWLDSACGGTIGDSVSAGTFPNSTWMGETFTGNLNPCSYAAWHLGSFDFGGDDASVGATYVAQCNGNTPAYTLTFAVQYSVAMYTFNSGDPFGLGYSGADYPDWSFSLVGGVFTGTYSSGGVSYTFRQETKATFGALAQQYDISVTATTSTATSITMPGAPIYDLMGFFAGTATIS